MKLNEENIRTIQTRIADIITFSKNELDVKDQRQKLAQVLNIENITSLNSVGAHLRIKADKVLKEENLSDTFKRDDLIAAHTYWTLGLSWSEIKPLMKDKIEGFNMTSQAFYELVGKYSDLLDGVRVASNTPSIAPKEKHKIDNKTKKSDAAEIDYDTNKRRALHSRFAEYLKNHLPENERRHTRVLAMLGAKVEMEAKIYLEAGIPPENIVTVERNLKAFEIARKNCERLGGIKCVHGELIDLLRMKKPPFDRPFKIVSYDFIGAFCTQYIDIVQNTSLCKGAIIRINLRAAREDAEGSDRIRSWCHMRSEKVAQQADNDAKAGRSEREIMLNGVELMNRLSNEREENFSKIRDEHLEDVVMENFGLQNQNHNLCRMFKFHNPPEGFKTSSERVHATKIKLNYVRFGAPLIAEQLASTLLGYVDIPRPILSASLVVLFEGLPDVRDVEKYAYKSSARARHTFLTSFARMDKGHADVINASHRTLEPISKILDRGTELFLKGSNHSFKIELVKRSRKKEEVIRFGPLDRFATSIRLSINVPENEKSNLKLYIPLATFVEDLNRIFPSIMEQKNISSNDRIWIDK